MRRFQALFVPLALATVALAMPVTAGAFPRGLDFHDDDGLVVVTPSVSLGRLGGDTLYRIGGDFEVPGQASGTATSPSANWSSRSTCTPPRSASRRFSPAACSCASA